MKVFWLNFEHFCLVLAYCSQGYWVTPLVARYYNAPFSQILSCLIEWVQHILDIACDLSHRTPVSNHDGTNCRRGNCLADIAVLFLPFHVQPLGVAGVILRKGLLDFTWGAGLEEYRIFSHILAVSGSLAFYCCLAVSDGVNFPFPRRRLISCVLVFGTVLHLEDNTYNDDVLAWHHCAYVVNYDVAKQLSVWIVSP